MTESPQILTMIRSAFWRLKHAAHRFAPFGAMLSLDPRTTTSIVQDFIDRAAHRLPVDTAVLSGRCNICGKDSTFHGDPAKSRESLLCNQCLTTSRYRSIARGVLRALREVAGVEAASLSDLRRVSSNRGISVYDTQLSFYYANNAYPIPDILGLNKWIEVETSIYRASQKSGERIARGISVQNLEELSFPNECFDIVITSDVMEHIRLDEKAHKEIYRVLKPQGVYLFTVPHQRQSRDTLTQVEVIDPLDSTRDRFLTEPEYHGDANSPDNRALSYRVYGTILDEQLDALGFSVDYTREDFLENGIQNTELFYCRKVR